MPTFSERVFDIVKQIPEGKVSTYGQIARMMGSPRSARYVGWALRGNKEPVPTPCHRVIFKDGRICEGYAFGGPDVQRKLLEDEGVAFVDDMHVDMESCLWAPEADRLVPPSDIDWKKEMGL
ncbi:MGMT family protein [Raoultibacter massiliensis]|uniref:MGMT family protein n=1 Tax=Raoultibacter massiliensis TaxID=1852371 RepID=UPI000C83399F|nr:MGMT family protein [Raoultibacter massiliensis]